MSQTYKKFKSDKSDEVRHPKRILRTTDYHLEDDEYADFKASDFRKLNVEKIRDANDDRYENYVGEQEDLRMENSLLMQDNDPDWDDKFSDLIDENHYIQ